MNKLTYTFITSRDVPSGWKYTAHRYAEHNWAKKFAKDFKNMELINKPASGYFKKVKLTRMIPNARNMYDYDNYVFGCKPLIDWLVKKGVIEGDKPNQVTVKYKQEISPRKKDPAHVEIELYE